MADPRRPADPQTRRPILVLNPGSATLKFGLYRVGDGEARLADGIVDRLGTPQARLRISRDGQPPRDEPAGALSPGDAAGLVVRELGSQAGAVGCRVVHGGMHFTGPERVTPQVVGAIRELAPLAPLHNPVAADVLEACLAALPDAPVYAVFDTAFHRTLPPVACTYGLPSELAAAHGIRRYGFHGIAHRWVAETLRNVSAPQKPADPQTRRPKDPKTQRPAPSRLINLHLGSGCSACAMLDGVSVDTSMGFTPMEGLVMGTRPGALDPAILLYLQREAGYTAETLDDLLNHRSGLLGISGRSGDMRDLQQAARGGDAQAELAIEVFAYQAAKTVGAYAVALEGLDVLSFSGGIGEHSADARARICRRLSLFSLTLDDERNEAAAGDAPARISADSSGVQVWVVPANEDLQIAREVSAGLDRA